MTSSCRPTDIPGFVPAWDGLKRRYGTNASRALRLLEAHATGSLRLYVQGRPDVGSAPWAISDKRAVRNAALIARGKR